MVDEVEGLEIKFTSKFAQGLRRALTILQRKLLL
jgi:hypothetical protein